jgi:MoaA/NifB/PqqE/SkfB family radical SAM enzyme
MFRDPAAPTKPAGNFTLRSNRSFHDEGTRLAGIAREGDFMVAACEDPQILLVPKRPLRPGWWQFILRIEGEVNSPRVYFQFGGGFSETWALALEPGDMPYEYRAVAWLPGRARVMRLDPSNRPARFRVHGFFLDPLSPVQMQQVLSARRFVSPVTKANLQQGIEARVRYRLPRPGKPAIFGSEANARVVFARQSHFSGVSLHIDDRGLWDAAVRVEVFAFEAGQMQLIRTARLELANADCRHWQHLYWKPIEGSEGRFYLVRALELRGDRPVAIGHKIVLDVRAIHSTPGPATELPQALVFSPVTQCNLNCTHCISRSTRTKMSEASEHVWNEVASAARSPGFVHLATDYSGDILFNEVRHGGWLSRMIELDVPFRIDTNANCLEDPIIEKLVASRLNEINFSLDSMDPGVYAKVRRGSIPLDEVLAKVERFMARKRVAAPQVRTILSFVLMRSNASTIKPALAFAREHGIDFVNVVPLIAFTPDMVEEILVWDTEAYRVLHEDLQEEAALRGVALHMQPPVRRFHEHDGHMPCNIPWGAAFVLGNGDVMACCVPGSRIGSLKDRTLKDLWHGPEYAAFRTRVNSSDPPEPCRNCPMNRVHDNRKAYAPARYGRQPPRVIAGIARAPTKST